MSVPMPVMSKANNKPNASKRKLRLSPNCGSQCQVCKITWPLKTALACVRSKLRLLKLTAIAPKAVAPRENCFSQGIRIVPKTKGNKIIIGSTLVSIVVIRPKPRVNLNLSRTGGPQRVAQNLILKAFMCLKI